MGKAIIALNLKAFEQSVGDSGLKLCETAAEVSLLTGVRIIACPDATLLHRATQTGAEVFAQHVDGVAPGQFTGYLTSPMLKAAGVKGSIVNHSEHRIPYDEIKFAIDSLHASELESMVCTKDVPESVQLSIFKPTYIAIEPPELIGTGISVSNAKPEVVTGAVQAVRQCCPNVRVICGAGVSTPADVKRAAELGAEGVLLASAFVKAKDPRALLEEMARQL